MTTEAGSVGRATDESDAGRAGAGPSLVGHRHVPDGRHIPMRDYLPWPEQLSDGHSKPIRSASGRTSPPLTMPAALLDRISRYDLVLGALRRVLVSGEPGL
jgi:hypothetical protein